MLHILVIKIKKIQQRNQSRGKKKEKECNSRESNPGLIRGRDLSYHLTTIAQLNSST